MDGKHKQLLGHCTELLKTYDGEWVNMEEHMDYYLQSNRIHDEEDEIFIKEVFSGCIRHRDIMQVVTESFFVKDGKNILRSNDNVFLVLVYLALFRLDELGMVHFRKFVSVLDTNTSYKLLNFMFDETNIMTWMKDEWNKVYDQSYVQKNLLSPILRWLPELQDLMKLLRGRMDNVQMPKRSPPATEPKPFNLTKPRARTIPIPDKVPKLIKSKPPPKSLYRPSAVQDAIDKQKEENRKKAEGHLMEVSKLQFACANPEKSDKTKQHIQNILIEENLQADSCRIKAIPPPNFKKDHLPVKMTSAAILREGLLYKKQENEVIEKLKKLEAGAYDSTDFYKWQSQTRQQDLEMKLAADEERRLKGKLSHEEAILACTNLIAENQVKVQTMKKETAALMREYLEHKFEMEKEMKLLVENTVAGHKHVKDAKKQLKEYKQRLVQEVKEESRDLMKQALEEAEAEMRCKMDLIQQIRAMEATPVSHVKMVDLTSTNGPGLLGEMSVVELRERLAIVKAERKEQEEIRRDNIISAKQMKADYISETMDMITKCRAEKTKAGACKYEQHKKNKCTTAPFRNENLIELERKLQEKRAERLNEQQKMKLLPSQKSARRTTQILQKTNLEVKRWRELEQAQERAVKLLS